MERFKLIVTAPFLIAFMFIGALYLSIFGKDEDFYRPDDV